MFYRGAGLLMKCAYCKSPVPLAANVCPVCRRDLYLINQFVKRVNELERELSLLKSRCPPSSQVLSPEILPANPSPKVSGWASLSDRPGWLIMIPLALLSLVHWMLSAGYEVNPLLLRLSCLVIPFPFGFIAYRWRKRPLWVGVLAAALMGLVGVFKLYWINALVEVKPFLPNGLDELRELVEFATGLALSGIAGILIGRHKLRAANGETRDYNIFISAMPIRVVSDADFVDIIRRANAITTGITALSTSAVSAYVGVRSLL